MSTRAKGLRNEKKTTELLLKEGYFVERPNYSRFGRKDFFCRWDVIAIKDDDIRFIQVKTNRIPPPKERRRLADFPEGKWSREIWIWIDRVKEPRIIYL